jgi:hypothetical protein
VRALAVAGLVLLGLGLGPRPARATCGAEGCPLLREGLGPHAARVSFGLHFQEVTQDELWEGGARADRDELIAEAFASGGLHGEIELYTRTRTWAFEGRARLHPRLDATLSLPYHEREHRHMLVHAPFYDPRFVDTWTYEGLGDATVLGHYRALSLAAGAALTLQAGVKLPTGRRHLPDEERVNFGEHSMLEPAARPGSGSTDWLLGAQATQPLPWRGTEPVRVSVLARWNGRGTDHYRVGDELQAGLGLGYSPVPWLSLLGQANFTGHGADRSEHAGEPAHSGMRALYLTPGVSVQVARALAVYALVQSRVWGETDDASVLGRSRVLVGTTLSRPR